MKILTEMPTANMQYAVEKLADRAHANYGDAFKSVEGWREGLFGFMREREEHLLERRGFEAGEAKSVADHWRDPSLALRCIEAVAKYRSSPEFKALAALFKRIKNITKDADGLPGTTLDELKTRLKEPAELVLAEEIIRRGPAINESLLAGRFGDVMEQIVALQQPVDRFFADVLVMAEDQTLRAARLAFLVRLKKQILLFADPSAIVQDEKQA